MPWWLLSYLRHVIDPPKLTSITRTHQAGHLLMAWSYIKPTRAPIWRNVRGIPKLCGYYYKWDTSYLQEQQESGETLDHTFNLDNLLPNVYVYYYLFSFPNIWPRLNQSQLITVFTGAPAAPPFDILIYSNEPLYPWGGIWYNQEHECVSYDYGNMYCPGGAPEIQIQSSGLYQMGFRHWWISQMGAYHAYRFRTLNLGVLQEVWTTPVPGQPDPPEDYIELQQYLDLGDYLYAELRHPDMAAREIRADPPYTPRFWAQKIG